MVTLEGICLVDDNAPKSNQWPEYLAKYAEPYRRWGMDADDTAQEFWIACRISPERVRAW